MAHWVFRKMTGLGLDMLNDGLGLRPDFPNGFTNRDANMVVPWTLSLPFAMNYRGGVNSDGCILGTLTHTMFDKVFMYDDGEGSPYTDDTLHAGDAAGDVELLPATPAEDDAVYFGCASKFSGIVVDMKTAGDGTHTAFAWEYWNGSAWTAIPAGSQLLDDSDEFTTGTDTYVISFIPPSDWATTTVNSSAALYWVRFRITGASQYGSAAPVAQQLWALKWGTGTGVVCPFTGTIDRVDLTSRIKSGDTANTVFLLINKDQGTAATLTWTKEIPVLSLTGLDFSVTAGDELILQQMTEDGTTEFTDVNVIAHIET